MAESYNYLGLTYHELQEFDQAKSCHQQAITIFAQIKTPMQINKTQTYLQAINR